MNPCVGVRAKRVQFGAWVPPEAKVPTMAVSVVDRHVDSSGLSTTMTHR
jgi:hypothetical protein